MVFSDEKRFKVLSDGPVRVWRRKGERYLAGFTAGTVRRDAPSIMVWAAIQSTGHICLRLCPRRMGSLEYQSVLATAMAFIRRRGTGAYFQQDGASCHRSASTLRWLTSNGVRHIHPWPAQSPDLNIIEHVWPMITRRLQDHTFPNAAALWAGVQAAAAAIPPADIANLYASIHRRFAACKAVRGGNTRY